MLRSLIAVGLITFYDVWRTRRVSREPSRLRMYGLDGTWVELVSRLSRERCRCPGLRDARASEPRLENRSERQLCTLVPCQFLRLRQNYATRPLCLVSLSFLFFAGEREGMSIRQKFPRHLECALLKRTFHSTQQALSLSLVTLVTSVIRYYIMR